MSGTPKRQPAKRGEASPDQSRRFIETARELGCDEDPEAFKRAVRKLAKAPPAPRQRSRKKDGKKTDQNT